MPTERAEALAAPIAEILQRVQSVVASSSPRSGARPRVAGARSRAGGEKPVRRTVAALDRLRGGALRLPAEVVS